MSNFTDILKAGESATHRAVTVDRPSPDRAIVTLNEPESMNALSAAICVQLNQAFEELAREHELRTIVLTGAGAGFSAGGDMEMMEMGAEGVRNEPGSTDVWRWIRQQFGGVVRKIASIDKAVIAAINGPAAGVGLAFALTCDIAIASQRAVLVPAFGKIGLVPEVGTSWALTRRLGYQGAFAFFAGGKHVDAEEAERLGLVHEVVEHERLLERADQWAERINRLPAHALEMSKPLLRGAADMSWDGAIRMEEFAEANCFTTGAFRDAVSAFRA